jgi:hypothetical protein
MQPRFLATVAALVPIVASSANAGGGLEVFSSSFEDGSTCAWAATEPDVACERVFPSQIDDVLTNPGMGFANFHFGWWCNLPPVTFTPQECADRTRLHWPLNYPDAGTAYFRWTWADLEPVRGEIDFDLIDATLQSANLLGETLGFRVMTILEGGEGVPSWLLGPPWNVPGEDWDGTFWPDYRDPVFRAEHLRFISALGARYNGHPAMDHVDIGSVGCWGEWNTACLNGANGIFEVLHPANDAERQVILDAFSELIDHVLQAFPDTPVVMLGLDANPPSGETNWELLTMLHATGNGAGWRVDCWGDWGLWGPAWNHMEDLYPVMIANATAVDPEFPEVFQSAPIQLEVCGTMPQWWSLGWTVVPPDGEVYRTFQWALEQHASVLNAKFTEIPTDYVAAIDSLLRDNGYRLVVDRVSHRSQVEQGGPMTIATTWLNLGVAPPYNPRSVAYRLTNSTETRVLVSDADIRLWLPGTTTVVDTLTVPIDLPAGLYDVGVAVLDRNGTEPATLALEPLDLGIAGRQTDGWYPLSQVAVE